jgi:DNA-directed RNA polymerase specialized sigma24 family protein
MDLAEALDELPEVHATAIRLHRAGTNAAAIAAVLHIEKEAVAPLLQVADAKLAALLKAPVQSREGDPANPPDHGDSHLGEPDEQCRVR